uniref:DUF19 domain-containing protein n=1 Tax=Strigamia maritima TaxID=126957 RepID=T1J5L2_STRMM
MLKTRSISILFVFVISVSAQSDSPLVKYLQGNGGSCLNEQLEKAVKNYGNCISDFLKKVQNMQKPNRRFDYDIDTKQLCTLDFSKCFSDMGNALKMCLTVETYKEYFDNHLKLAKGAQSYVCSDGGKPLQDFLDHGIQCFGEPKTKQGIQKCAQLFENFTDKYFKREFHLENACRDISKGAKCYVEATDSCEDKTARNFLRNVIVKSFHDTDCRDIIAEDIPGSSGSVSAFSFLVVTAGMLAFLINL